MSVIGDLSGTQGQHPNWQKVVGGTLVVGGAMALLDQLLRLGWLAPLAPLVVGILLLGWGLRIRSLGFVIAGGILSGCGAGIAVATEVGILWPVLVRFGWLLIGLAGGFALTGVLTNLWLNRTLWWVAIPVGVLGAAGFCMALTQNRLLDYVLYLPVGVGVALLGSGVYKHFLGLIIPGSLLLGIGPGIFIAWGTPHGVNALASTGIMLLWFSLGWGVITLVSKMILDKFIWWPLIPGGVVAVVGCGLYIGGNPGQALSIIGNTGSIAVIIFGLYLMLMRRGIRR
jgi:hypothetical protein